MYAYSIVYNMCSTFPGKAVQIVYTKNKKKNNVTTIRLLYDR